MKEFKKFIQRGNVVDFAVGVIMGAAFGKIVSSLVGDIIMPFVGILIGGLDFSNLVIKIGESTIKYGLFLQNIVDFFIIAFCVFILVKIMNKIVRKKEEAVKVNKQEELLEEIRDIIKDKNNK